MIRRKTITVLRVFTCVLSYLTAKILTIVINGKLLNEYFKSPNVNFRDRYTFVLIDVESLIYQLQIFHKTKRTYEVHK